MFFEDLIIKEKSRPVLQVTDKTNLFIWLDEEGEVLFASLGDDPGDINVPRKKLKEAAAVHRQTAFKSRGDAWYLNLKDGKKKHRFYSLDMNRLKQTQEDSIKTVEYATVSKTESSSEPLLIVEARLNEAEGFQKGDRVKVTIEKEK